MSAVFEWIQANIVNVINFVAFEYWSNNMIIFVLLTACITLLFINKSYIKRGCSIFAVYSVLLIALVLLNPLVLKIYGDIREAYVLLPMGAIISVTLASKSVNIASKIKSNLLIIGLALLVIFTGLVTKTEDMVDSVNSYKVDDQGIIAAQYILEDSDYEPVTVCFVISDGETHGADISAYEAAVQFSGLINAIDAGPGDEQIWEGYDYLVINNDLEYVSRVNTSGYEALRDSGCYTILGRT